LPSPAEPHVIAAGYGHHEVIVETPGHNADLATLPGADLTAVVRTYRHRYAELMAWPAVKAVLVFRNHGRRAGASLPHPHSQVIATGMMPPRFAATTAWARSHYARQGRCVTCEELELELEDGRRVVEATERFLVLVPFAAASPFEQWILPRRHQASFAQTDDGELIEFGRLLQRALYRLRAALDGPSYNYAIESAAAGDADAPCIHWRLRIVPDLVTPGGFELGAGLPINPSWPEDDAEALRSATMQIGAEHEQELSNHPTINLRVS
jgi:UDPglucose--hexose-1-phosphate uridylyltransferase